MKQYVLKQDTDEQKDYQKRKQKLNLEINKKGKRKFRLIAITFAIFLILGSWIVFSIVSPGKYDEFAKCLTEKGVVMYGEDWCQYTNAQKNMFGNSFKYINYQIKTDLVKRPTWVIDGEKYATVQSFQRLSALTGCKY